MLEELVTVQCKGVGGCNTTHTPFRWHHHLPQPPNPHPHHPGGGRTAGTRGDAGRCGMRDSQVGDARFTDGSGDGFDGRAEGVEELRELPGAFRPPAFLHHEAGHGDDIGVESRAVRHGGGAGRVEPQPPPPPLAPMGRGLGVAGAWPGAGGGGESPGRGVSPAPGFRHLPPPRPPTSRRPGDGDGYRDEDEDEERGPTLQQANPASILFLPKGVSFPCFGGRGGEGHGHGTEAWVIWYMNGTETE